jgi:hypothetical protein
MGKPLRRTARRLIDQLAAPYLTELDAGLTQLDGRSEAIQGSVDSLSAELERARGELGAVAEQVASLAGQVDRASQVLGHICYEVAANRRRLQELRRQNDYELAFTESEPLVSFVVPTYRRFETLRDVALPSILSQSYSNIEVIVAGDGSPAETEEVITALNDPRIRYHNRTVRGPYPADESVRWYMIGTPPYNDGVSIANGRWIATLGDDDAVRPDHTDRLLTAAQLNRYEHCYARHLVNYPNGEALDVGSFPPEMGAFVLQASIYHAGLRFFQLEPADYLFKEPNDWSLCRRMLEAGVRFGMIDDVLVDKHESRYRSHADWGTHGIPRVE